MISKNPWFGPKKLGYGLRPVSWQGWLVIIALVIISSAILNLHLQNSPLIIISTLVVFAAIVYLTSD